jgi:hypothetical protein
MTKKIPIIFHNQRDTNSDLDIHMRSRVWDALDPKDGRELFMMRAKKELELGGGPKHILYQEAILNNFEKLRTYRDEWDEQAFYDNDDSIKVAHKGDVFYRDRGSKKTIVAFSSRGQWGKNLIMPTDDRWNHPEYDWIGKKNQGYDDYNFISLQEDITRAYTNPTSEPSALLRGINDELDSPQKVAEYVQSIFPGTELHFISDCKSTIATAYVAHLANARSLFLIAPIITLDKNRFIAGTNDEGMPHWDIHDMASINFIFYIRSMMYTDVIIPQSLNDVIKIAHVSPQMQTQIYYHENDGIMHTSIDLLTQTTLPDNLNVTYIEDTKYCSGNHHIINEVRKSRYYNKFLDNMS